MSHKKAKQRHADLSQAILEHDHAYFVEAKPTISDYGYDQLFQELLEIEKEFPDLATPESPTQRVGGKPTQGFKRVKHLQPMLSLEKIEASDQPDTKAEPDREKRHRLQDENTLNKLRSFDATIRKQLGRDQVQYIIEPKVDGVSIGVHYRDGKLALGVTRGDGQRGDDITANLKTVRSIPLHIKSGKPPALLEVRGEAYMSIADFEKLNATLEEAGEKPFPNARNATAGALKQLDPALVAKRPIRAVFYAVGALEDIEFETHSGMLEQLKKLGLPTQQAWWVCDGIEEVIRVYRDEIVCGYDEDRDLRTRLPYEIDGIVLKVNTVKDWSRIPSKTRAPGYAIVHKPIPWITPAETVLKAITVQVGRTGVLTPVAELEPVFVQGSTVSRATLHNEDEIRRKDIRIGDTVLIRKAGMVIPEVFDVVKSKRPKDAKVFDLVKHIGNKCPACGGPIAKEKLKSGRAELPFSPDNGDAQQRVPTSQEEVAWRCQNVAGCPAQLTRRVEYFAQRKALDIESLGGIVAEKLVERGLVKNPLDLFDLEKEQLATLNLGTDEEPRVFGEKNATKVVEALERAKSMPLDRWIFALAIPNVGDATAYQLSQVHKSLADLAESDSLRDIRDQGRKELEKREVNPRSRSNPPKDDAEKQQREKCYSELKDDLKAIEDRLKKSGVKDRMAEIGPVIAGSILVYFESKMGKAVLKRLEELGIDPKSEAVLTNAAAKKDSPAAGKTFVLTGTLPNLTRDDASKLIRDAGGNVTSSVSKNTDYVVAGESAGSKFEKAQKLGVKVIDEVGLKKLLNE